MRSQTTRTISGVVAGDGSLQRTNDLRVSVTRTGTGAYALRLPADVRMIGLAVSLTGGGNYTLGASAVTANTATVQAIQANTGAATDNAWSFAATVAA